MAGAPFVPGRPRCIGIGAESARGRPEDEKNPPSIFGAPASFGIGSVTIGFRAAELELAL